MASSKDPWSDLVQNHMTDLFSISTSIGKDTEEALEPITNVVSRMKQGKTKKYQTDIKLFIYKLKE